MSLEKFICHYYYIIAPKIPPKKHIIRDSLEYLICPKNRELKFLRKHRSFEDVTCKIELSLL